MGAEHIKTTQQQQKKTTFRRLTRVPRKLLRAFVMESIETKEMVHIFVRQGKGFLLGNAFNDHPSPAELAQAREQLKDLPKFIPFIMIVAAPVPGMAEGYLLLAVTLERLLGQRISLLPTQFRNIFHKPRPAASILDIELATN